MPSVKEEPPIDQASEDLNPSIIFFGNEFPSDDLKDLFRRLHRHSKDRRFRTLNSFLQECARVLHDEVDKLPQPVKDEVPHFENVLALAEHGEFRPGPLGAAFESALLTVLQLGLLIGQYEAVDSEPDLSGSRLTLAGLSIGLLTGAAVALSRSLADIARNGTEAVRVGFRLGVYVDDFSRKLEAPQPDGTMQSWAQVVTGMSKDIVHQEVATFNEHEGGPELTKVFISAADKASVSVTGPPSRLKGAFQHSHALRYSKSLPLPVYDGLCHASHVYSEEDVEAIINSAESLIPASRPVRLPLLSSETGKPYAATTAEELFLEIGTELLTGTIYLDNVTAGIANSIDADRRCSLATFRTSLVLKSILAGIDEQVPNLDLNRHDLVSWSLEDSKERRPRTHADSKLAIVGMACRMPGGANNPDEFWELLEQGRDVHTTVPPDRFDLETHYDPTGQTENATQTQYGNFIDRPGYFDAGFFRMSPKEAEQTDPMQRLALVTAYEAMEMAGVVPDRTPSTCSSRIGTWYGEASDDWRELNASQNVGTYAVPGGVRGFTTGRINYYFKFSGPSFCIDTACSSSMAAVHAACSALWAGEVDTALAGGVNVITDPDNYAGLCNAHFLSKTGQCKVWDKDADGYCRAEGVGSIVIKRLEDAVADNDNIIATVLSGATNHSAEAISITHPHAGAQRDNYRTVLNRAGINPLDVSFVEMHGTGTQAGDAIESESVLDIFAPLPTRRRADQHLYLGAVKSNIGHGEAVAGISSLIKALLVYQNSYIPKHVGIKTEINPVIPKDLDRRHVGLAMDGAHWPRPSGGKRIAMVNSFGAHGGNTTLLLEDGPEKAIVANGGDMEDRASHTVTVSAKSKKSLQANIENLLVYIDKHPEASLADLSYTTSARRMHHNFRVATAASSIAGLQHFLRSALDESKLADVKSIPAEAPSAIFTFTGQGASYQGIRKELFDEFPYFREQVIQLNRIVQRLGFPSVISILDGSNDEEVESPVESQLSIVVLEIALARLWAIFGVKPSAVIGHSLGEYSALAVSGVLSVTDTLYLVGRRAQLTEELCTSYSHAMLSVRASTAEIARTIKSEPGLADVKYEVSCRNTHEDTVLGARTDDIDAIRKVLESKSYKCIVLNLPFAFHSEQVQPVLNSLESLAKHIPFKAPSIPYLSPLLGHAIFDGKTINAEYLRMQMRRTVDFVSGIEAAQELGMVDDRTLWIDCGPHPVCAGLVRGLIPQARTMASCRRGEDNMTTLAKSLVTMHLAGLTPCWHEYFKPREQACSLLSLPKYAWNEVNYWIPYIGTWTLDKALLKYGGSFGAGKAVGTSMPATKSGLRTSTIHHVTEEIIEELTAHMSVISDMQHPDFLAAVHGHQMNNCGVATSSIWSDMAYAVGEYLYRKMVPSAGEVHMNIVDVEVLHAQVAKKNKGSTQPLSLEADLDLDEQLLSLAWYNVDAESGERASESFATGFVRFEDPRAWSTEWKRMTHLVHGRIEALEQMANEGRASRLPKNMAYTLFKNVVDYADKYRGMDCVIMNEYEAMADVTLVPELHGTWHTPPHWIDSVCHLGGLIMNGSDASNTADYFYVTPGFESFRLAEPLTAGTKYRSYIRMFPLPVEEGNMYAGDLFILREGEIIGMLGQMKFRRVPRVLMDRFFSPPKAENATSQSAPAPKTTQMSPPRSTTTATKKAKAKPRQAKASARTLVQDRSSLDNAEKKAAKLSQAENVVVPVSTITPPDSDESGSEKDEPGEIESGPIGQCLQLIAQETNLDMSELTTDATFAQLGVDSLMSLVLSEKIRKELGLEIKSSLFLECPTVGEMKAWLEQYC